MLSDVQYKELFKCYEDPIKTLSEQTPAGCKLVRSIFVDYVNIKDIVSCSLVNRSWKQMLSNDPNILLNLCGRQRHLNNGFRLQPAFFSDNVRNNSETMLKFLKISEDYTPTGADVRAMMNGTYLEPKTYFYFCTFLGDHLDKKFYVEAVKIFGSRLLCKIPKDYFYDPDFVLALAYVKVRIDRLVDDICYGFKMNSIDYSTYWLSIFERCEKLDIFESLENYFIGTGDYCHIFNQDSIKKVKAIKNKKWGEASTPVSAATAYPPSTDINLLYAMMFSAVREPPRLDGRPSLKMLKVIEEFNKKNSELRNSHDHSDRIR